MLRQLFILLGFWGALSALVMYTLGYHFDSPEQQERDSHVDTD